MIITNVRFSLDCRNISLKFKIFIIFNALKKNSDLKAVYSPDSAL